MALRLVPAHERDMPEVSRFIDEYWPRKILLTDPVFHAWQMLNPPLAQGKDHSWLILDDEDDTIQGYYGGNPREFVDERGDIHPGAELTTIFFTPRVRGGAMVWELVKTLQRQYAVLVGMNTNSMALPIFRFSGFRHIRAVERMTRVYQSAFLERVGGLTPMARNLLSLQKRAASKTSPSWRVPDREELQTLFTGYRIPGVAHFRRDFTNLAWRLLDHPYFRYECLLVAPDQPEQRTLLVFREERHENFAVGHVVDVLPLGRDLPDLAAVCDRLAADRQIDMIDAMFTQPRVVGIFWQRNWLSTLNDPEVRVPNVFNPPELRDPPTGNVTYWSHESVGSLTNLCGLHLSKIDGDWDRPTQAWLDAQNNRSGGG
ncbi:MAG: hypothetical protein HQL95_14930 [Magnetococcales bacterium]|nr:hypothetical protein [Magnetococcales bacterium]